MVDEMAPGSDEPSRSGSSASPAGRWDALSLAIKAHEGQTDKGGAPYIGHCLHVANSAYETAIAEGWSYRFALRCYRVGLLHDVLEDCDWATVEMVESAIGGIDAQAVFKLTKKDGQDRQDYLDAIARNQLTSIVKRCDIAHNMDLRRIPLPSKDDLRRREKYRSELDFLKQAARHQVQDNQQAGHDAADTEPST